MSEQTPLLRRLPGLEPAKPMTHVEALELDRLPEHLFVQGGVSSDSNSRKRCGARKLCFSSADHLWREAKIQT
jgi:hypothetical protein